LISKLSHSVRVQILEVKGASVPQISLDQIVVAEPCHASWNQMRGNGAGRFCSHCQKTVHDLSAMPSDEAERLLCRSVGELCIRFTKAADGQVLTLDYRTMTGKRRWSWKIWTVIALIGALTLGVVNAALFGTRVMPARTVIMGALPALPNPTPNSTPLPCGNPNIIPPAQFPQ
jgi:hypothetical protein